MQQPGETNQTYLRILGVGFLDGIIGRGGFCLVRCLSGFFGIKQNPVGFRIQIIVLAIVDRPEQNLDRQTNKNQRTGNQKIKAFHKINLPGVTH